MKGELEGEIWASGRIFYLMKIAACYKATKNLSLAIQEYNDIAIQAYSLRLPEIAYYTLMKRIRCQLGDQSIQFFGFTR